MNRPLVIGNWKMNLDYVEAVHLIQQLGVVLKNKPLEHVDLVVAPPFVDIRSVTSVVESERVALEVGAQHASVHESGAHTGEVSVSMLQRLNVGWVLVGHSERRAMYAMTDEVVAQTLRTVVRQGLNAVLCVGEELSVREVEAHQDFVSAQLHAALEGLDEKSRPLVTIAYEPVWAIGTGLTATTTQVGEMTEHIRTVAASLSLGDVRVLYGGSVNADNATALMNEGRVDGFLVGGASLKADSFLAIAQAANDCYDSKR
ncbi:MAG: triose-phosphate isomerase [Actinomycetota bacterium]|nr:triose-phosphate isomerase [Actinomycetota bacterium]